LCSEPLNRLLQLLSGSHHRLSLAVVAEASGLQHGGQSHHLQSALRAVGVYLCECGGRHAIGAQGLLLYQAVLEQAQSLWRGMHRQMLGKRLNQF